MSLRNPERQPTQQELEAILMRIQGLSILIIETDISYNLSPNDKVIIIQKAIDWVKTGINSTVELQRHKPEEGEELVDLVDVSVIIHSLL